MDNTFQINQLRVLNDQLNQTIDILVRGQRMGVGSQVPFTGVIPSVPQTMGTGVDAIYGLNPFAAYAATQPFGPTYPVVNPFTSSFPVAGLGAGYVDPFLAQRSTIGGVSWTQTQITQALLAKQQVLEAMCRAAGIQC